MNILIKKVVDLIEHKILIMLILIFPVILFSQENEEPGIAMNRAAWFMNQRLFPNGEIPSNCYSNALNSMKQIRQNGFFLNPITSWQCVGPNPMRWVYNQNSYTEYTGRFSCIKYAPSNPSIIYAGAADGGLWKSTNGGYNWVNLTDHNTLIGTCASGSIAIDPTDPNTVYYGTGEGIGDYAYVYYGRGIFKSIDGGTTWVKATINPPADQMDLTYVSRMLIDPTNSQTLYAALDTHFRNVTNIRGLYKSVDGGLTWNRICPDLNQPGLSCFDVQISNNGQTIYACGPHNSGNNNEFDGIDYRISTDAGVSFAQIHSLDGLIVGFITLAKTNQNILYAISPIDEFHARIYKSSDGGYSFSNVFSSFGGMPNYDLYIYVSPYDENLVYAGCGGIISSTNGGINWNDIFSAHADQHNLDFYPDPNHKQKIAFVNDGGAWSIDETNNIIDFNHDLNGAEFYKVSGDPNSIEALLAGAQDHGWVHKDPGNGSTIWYSTESHDGGYNLFDPLNPGFVIGNDCDAGNLYRSVNSGAIMQGATLVNASQFLWQGGPDWLAPLAMHPTTSGLYYTARRRNSNPPNYPTAFIISTDLGATWVAANYQL
jgi:hypothetical protein